MTEQTASAINWHQLRISRGERPCSWPECEAWSSDPLYRIYCDIHQYQFEMDLRLAQVSTVVIPTIKPEAAAETIFN